MASFWIDWYEVWEMSFVLSHSMKVQWMSWTILQIGDWAQMLRPVLPGHHLRAVWCSHVSWAAIVTGDFYCWFIDNSFIQGLLIHSQFNFRDPLKINTSSRWTLGVTWCASLTWVIGHLDSGWTAQQRGIGQLSGFFCSTVRMALDTTGTKSRNQWFCIDWSGVLRFVIVHIKHDLLSIYIYIYLCLLNDNWSEAAGVEVAVSLESMSWSFWGQDAEVMMNFLTLECSWSLGVDMGCGVQKCVQWHILESSGSNLFCQICP